MRRAILAVLMSVAAAAASAQTPLYPTGPAEDSAFLRFVTAAHGQTRVRPDGGAAELVLDAARPASRFQAVAGGSTLRGTLVRGARELPVAIEVEPGEFATVLLTEDKDGAPQTQVLREAPDDFNAQRASLALYAADPDCAEAGLTLAGRELAIFGGVPAGSVMRRQLNPLTIEVQARCGGKAVGAPALLELRAGGRYSALIVPARGGPRLIVATDLD